MLTFSKVFIRNKDKLEPFDSTSSYLFSLPQKITSYRFLNTLSNSRSNISAHYDISNEMFEGALLASFSAFVTANHLAVGFLSKDMTYSCAIFSQLDGDLSFNPSARPAPTEGRRKHSLQLPSPPYRSGETTQTSSSPDDKQPVKVSSDVDSEALIAKLHSTDTMSSESGEDELYFAQIRKLDHIIDKLKISPGVSTKVLEIGSGWGSMAIRITERYPLATIDTLTLSVQQQDLARERIKARGEDIEKRIRVHLMDYRAMPKDWEGVFDRVVSVEMVEAVGKEFLEEYWRTIDWAMKRKGAVGVVQGITLPEARE